MLNSDGISPLFVATRNGTEFEITVFSFRFEIIASQKMTAFFSEIIGHQSVVDILVRHNASVNFQEQTFGNTSLHVAADKGFL